jgi:DMSO/TMAO reductase YedYZ molybdopterin-dependent catalytic subunit
MDKDPADKIEREKRAGERLAGQAPSANRLPPGQYLTDRFPVLHYGSVPKFDPQKWDFKVWGLVAHPITWTYEQVRAQPATRITRDIHCVTRWTQLDMIWEGMRFGDLAAIVQPKPEAKFVLAHCEQGFTANVPLAKLMDEDVLLAYRYADAELSPEHGYPLRLLVPKLYFWKSAKWLRGLEFMAKDKLGFWEKYGYHNDADPWLEQRYA